MSLINNNITDNSYLIDAELSLKAKGLLGILINFSGENLNMEDIKGYTDSGVTQIKNTLKELKKVGYLLSNKIRNKKGRVDFIFKLENKTPKSVLNDDIKKIEQTSVPTKKVLPAVKKHGLSAKKIISFYNKQVKKGGNQQQAVVNLLPFLEKGLKEDTIKSAILAYKNTLNDLRYASKVENFFINDIEKHIDETDNRYESLTEIKEKVNSLTPKQESEILKLVFDENPSYDYEGFNLKTLLEVSPTTYNHYIKKYNRNVA